MQATRNPRKLIYAFFNRFELSLNFFGLYVLMLRCVFKASAEAVSYFNLAEIGWASWWVHQQSVPSDDVLKWFLHVPMINSKIRQFVMVHSWTLSWMFSLLWLSLSILLLTFFSAVWLSFSQTFVCCRDFSWKEGSLRTEGGSHSWWDVLSLSLSIMLMIQVCCLEMLPDCSFMWIRCMFSCAGT